MLAHVVNADSIDGLIKLRSCHHPRSRHSRSLQTRYRQAFSQGQVDFIRVQGNDGCGTEFSSPCFRRHLPQARCSGGHSHSLQREFRSAQHICSSRRSSSTWRGNAPTAIRSLDLHPSTPSNSTKQSAPLSPLSQVHSRRDEYVSGSRIDKRHAPPPPRIPTTAAPSRG